MKLKEIQQKIDISKLSRDFNKFPLKVQKHNVHSEQISYNDLYYLYIELNLTRNEIAEYFKVSVAMIKKILKKYNLIKSNSLITHNILRIKDEIYGDLTYNNMDKYRETCLERYGVPYYIQTKEYLEKSIKTNLEKYGVENFSQSEQCKELYKNKDWVEHKVSSTFITKRKNGTCGKSKQEDKIYELLIAKFPNTQRWYSSELYPFECDFYVPELDLYIEYQGFFTHGKEPFDMNNIKHREKLDKWYEKGTKQFQKAIKTWTISDPLKRQTARDNNLNWIEFFNMEQFMNWFIQL